MPIIPPTIADGKKNDELSRDPVNFFPTLFFITNASLEHIKYIAN
jgi:hypothetical protein